MKNLLLLIASIFILSSCVTRLGDLTMISTRNIDSKTDYKELRRDVKAKGKTLEIAIDKATRQVPGGEFNEKCCDLFFWKSSGPWRCLGCE